MLSLITPVAVWWTVIGRITVALLGRSSFYVINLCARPFRSPAKSTVRGCSSYYGPTPRFHTWRARYADYSLSQSTQGTHVNHTFTMDWKPLCTNWPPLLFIFNVSDAIDSYVCNRPMGSPLLNSSSRYVARTCRGLTYTSYLSWSHWAGHSRYITFSSIGRTGCVLIEVVENLEYVSIIILAR